MRHFLTIILFFLILIPLDARDYTSVKVEDSIIEKTDLTLLEQTFIEVATPLIKKVNLNRIYIATDFENTLYTGGVQVYENNARIMFGSEFRSLYDHLSEDAYAEILCHELGHIVGETAKEYWPNGEEISPEAESDYFAGAVCLKKLFRAYKSNEFKVTDPIIANKCFIQYENQEERELCERVAMAGIDFFTSFHYSLKKLKVIQGHEKFYAKPDVSIKDSGFYTFYPSFQCRAETIISGSLCPSSESNFDLGKIDWHCHKSQNPNGVRPSCWYKH